MAFFRSWPGWFCYESPLNINSNLKDEINKIDENFTSDKKKSISYREYDDEKCLRKAMSNLFPKYQ